MSDAQAYLRRGKKIQSLKFGRAGVAREDGSASDSGDAERATRPHGVESVVIVNVAAEHRETRQLPMKKNKKKRSRGDSDDEGDVAVAEQTSTKAGLMSGLDKTNSQTAAPPSLLQESAAGDGQSSTEDHAPQEALELANVASPSSPVPPVEGVAQRISLLSKWFPAALQEGKLETALAPSVDFVENTADRMNKARDYILTLRYGIEDVETLLRETRNTHGSVWKDHPRSAAVTDAKKEDFDPDEDTRKRQYWELSGKAIAKLARVGDAGQFRAALSEFANDVPSSTSEVAAAMSSVARRRRRLHVPLEYDLKGWHDVLDRHGPEAGFVPHLSDVLWLSVAGATAMFTVITRRLLRNTRALAERTSAGNNSALQSVPAETNASGDGDGDEMDEETGPRFFDNTTAGDEGSGAAVRLERTTWISTAPFPTAATLSTEEKSLLAFLRYLMPVVDVGAAAEDHASAGFGVWLYAAFTTLDTPLDPDTARLAHDLFRTCCRHLRTLGTWKGVQGSTRNVLLKEFSSRQRGTVVAYTSLEEVAREDVLAIYTIVVVLARFFQQNQDHFIPL